MTAEQAINEITSELKYYVGVMPQSTAACFVIRFRKDPDSITPRTLKKFLHKFGYVQREGQWIKVKTERPEMNYK